MSQTKTIAEVIAACAKAKAQERPLDELDQRIAVDGPQCCPFWVVVVNPRRQPPEPKFVTGHRTMSEAEAECQRRQEQANEEAKIETRKRQKVGLASVEPFQFFAVVRPEDQL